MSRSERLTLALFALASVVLRSVAFFRYRFDSDEPQHLHVTWGWTAGLVQYRDYFDNHAPLFHLATAPLLSALGERADILLYMRAAMLPLFVVVLGCTYLIAERLYDRTIALWSVVVLSLFPSFFLKSIEYRTDNLWNTLWCVALVVFIFGPPTPVRWFIGGFLLGLALTTSLKTILLLITLAGAAIVTRYVLQDRTRFGLPLVAAISGLGVVPAIVTGYFVGLGAFDDFLYCTFTFNTLIDDVRPHVIIRRFVWPLAIAAIVVLARRSRVRDAARLFCAIVFGVYAVTLLLWWPLISPRDMLPIMPLGVTFIIAAFDRWGRRLVYAAASSIILIGFLFYYAENFQNHTEEFITMMNQVLRLTHRGEPIMDLKGETIYRPRPYYYIFERITVESMEKGLLADRVPESVVAHRCYVAQADGPLFPPRARAFLSIHFLDLGRLRAAGQWIRHDGSFMVAIPGPYVLVDVRGLARGSLDGKPFSGARFLAAGEHRFDRADAGERVASLWAPAFARGFSPFHLQDRDFPR